MTESSDPKTKLEIRYSGGHAGNVYVGSKTKEEVMELFKRFLDLPIEGLGVHFEWVLSTEAEGARAFLLMLAGVVYFYAVNRLLWGVSYPKV